MPKYRIIGKVIVDFELEVEAESEGAAEHLVQAMGGNELIDQGFQGEEIEINDVSNLEGEEESVLFPLPVLIKDHELGRPDEGAHEVERLLPDGTWVPDDGKPGLAFSGMYGKFPYAWHVPCDCDFLPTDLCPRRLALNYTCTRYHCANGREMRSVEYEKTK